jgi:hypothetical protein
MAPSYFKENQALAARLKRFKVEQASTALSRSRSSYSKVASHG